MGVCNGDSNCCASKVWVNNKLILAPAHCDTDINRCIPYQHTTQTACVSIASYCSKYVAPCCLGHSCVQHRCLQSEDTSINNDDPNFPQYDPRTSTRPPSYGPASQLRKAAHLTTEENSAWARPCRIYGQDLPTGSVCCPGLSLQAGLCQPY